MIRLYELSQTNDGLGGVSEEKALIYEGKGKVIKKQHDLENSPFAYEDRVYDVILPRQLHLSPDNHYELEVEE